MLHLPTNEDKAMRKLSFSEIDQFCGAVLNDAGVDATSLTMYVGGSALNADIVAGLTIRGVTPTSFGGFTADVSGFFPNITITVVTTAMTPYDS